MSFPPTGPSGRYLDWLRHAENYLKWARHSMSGGFFSQTCFISQQSAQKALKAYCFTKEFDFVKTHSLFQKIKALGENRELAKLAKELDLYYISGRYPDAFPTGAPFEMFTSEQADGRLEGGRKNIHSHLGEDSQCRLQSMTGSFRKVGPKHQYLILTEMPCWD